jgi:homoserine O-acetyltransferase
MTRLLLCFLLINLASAPAHAEPPQQFADIGDLELVSGEVLRDVRVGYRTAGELNGDRSNAILFPTWFTGTAAELFRYEKIGPGLLADTDRFHVIAVDSLGNGVSTSPSNSERQPGSQFPRIAIDDMVNAAHALLTKELGIDHLHAVMGISMGGMQTFQWVAQYPDFMDRAVPIDGSPQGTSYDLAQWQTHERAIELMLQAGVPDDDVTRFVNRIGLLNLWTPEYYVENIAPEDYAEWLAVQQDPDPMDPRDYLAQLQAMIESDCGHIGSSCEAWQVNAVVNAFLE